MQLSKDFSLEEMILSDAAARHGIDNRPNEAAKENLETLCVELLQPIRDEIDSPILINSGYRAPALNRLINGAPNSQHMEGKAADIICPGISPVRLFKMISGMGIPFDQLILEKGPRSTWVHISYSVDNLRGARLIATFPEGGGVRYQKISKASVEAL